jgi:hypothetical protein
MTLNGQGLSSSMSWGTGRGASSVLTTWAMRLPSGAITALQGFVMSGASTSESFFPSGASTQYAPSWRVTMIEPGPSGFAAG